MCLACDMEAMWFAAMEARADAAAAGESTEGQPDETAPPLTPIPHGEPATLLPPPERGRVGEGVAGGIHNATDSTRDESADPHPNPPPEEGGGGASAESASDERASGESASGKSASNEGTRRRQRSASPRRFACEETPPE
jgi:hypothetical protein